MKKSKYNFFTKLENGKYLLTNLVTGALVLLDPETYLQTQKILENPGRSVNSPLFLSLVEQGFLIPKDINEKDIVKENYWKTKLKNNQLNLTVIPTFNCNFDCSYCYQKGFEKKKMTKGIADRIYHLIDKKSNNLEVCGLHWFGGEALLCVDILEYIGKKVMDLCQRKKINFVSSVSTNGYLLNAENISLLKKIGVRQIETTLAGTEKYHNTVRFINNNRPTFKTIIENIELASKDFIIIIAINITIDNQKDIPNLLNYMKKNKLVKNVYIVFNQVQSYKNNECNHMTLCDNTYNAYIVNLYQYAMDLGLNICDVTKFRSECAYCSADYENSFTIDPDGFIYKCVERYSEDTREGYINENGDLVFDPNKNWYSKDVFNDETCKNCNILPYCYGGCSDKRKRQLDFCPAEKDYIEEYLKFFYQRLNKYS